MLGADDQPLSELTAQLQPLRQLPGRSTPRSPTSAAVTARLTEHFADRGELDRLDGLTVRGEDWWVNVRPSNTEPLLRLNVEAPTAEQVAELRDEALAIIRG